MTLLNTHLRLRQFAGQGENVWKVPEQELQELRYVEIELFQRFIPVQR